MAIHLGYIKSGMIDSGLLRKGFDQLDGAIGNIIKAYGAPAGYVVVKLSGCCFSPVAGHHLGSHKNQPQIPADGQIFLNIQHGIALGIIHKVL